MDHFIAILSHFLLSSAMGFCFFPGQDSRWPPNCLLCAEVTGQMTQSGPSSLKWNENLRPVSVTKSERSTFGGGLFGLQSKIGLSIKGTGNLIFDRKIRI